MASSLFSTFCSTSLLLLGALVSAGFRIIGSKFGNMAMAMAIEEFDSMALLPFGSVSGIRGSFIPQCSGFSSDRDSPQEFVNAHNVARAQVGVGPIQWDTRVANFATQYANQRINDCRLVHSSGPYGENLAWGSPDLSSAAAVRMWVDEKRFYNYAANSCAPFMVCGHYTQVVWRNSVRIGCAKVRCRNNGGIFITCNYDPPGNFVGQRPY